VISPATLEYILYVSLRRILAKAIKGVTVKTSCVTRMSTRGRLSIENEQVKISPACTNCREKHLRCSGAPLCTRCKNDGAQCIFVPSRRGMRPPKAGRSPTPQAQPSSSSQPHWTPIQPVMLQPATNVQWAPTATPQPPFPQAYAMSGPGFRTHRSQPVASDSLSMELINSTYENFLPLHPFALPKEILIEHLTRPEVQHLRAVIEYIGSFYCPAIDKATYADCAERLLFSHHYPQNAYTVQAFLLLAMRLAADGEHQKAVRGLQLSRDCALLIGMNRHDFPQLHSGASPLQEASWRATWEGLTQLCQAWSIDSTVGAATRFEPQADVTTSRKPSSAFEPRVATRLMTTSRATTPGIDRAIDGQQRFGQTSAEQQIGGRRSSTTMSIHRQMPAAVLATTWDHPAALSSTSMASLTLGSSHGLAPQISRSHHSEEDYFNRIVAYGSTALPRSLQGSGWTPDSQREDEPKPPASYPRH